MKTTEKQETTPLQSLFGAYQSDETADFAEFVVKQYEERKLTEGIQQLTATSQAFDFLNNEEDLYSEADLKEVYHAQR
ncbi:MAG: hypothetical protein H7Z72_15920 [Bacteroidetes bacterium]|nr:hypothetical protein [Fibrella sp.]